MGESPPSKGAASKRTDHGPRCGTYAVRTSHATRAARGRRFCRASQFILRALHLAEHIVIARVDPLVASRHAFIAGGEHLTGVLLPDSKSVSFLFERERAILNQFIRRRVVRLRMFYFIGF